MLTLPIAAPILLVLLLVVAAPAIYLAWGDLLLGTLRLEWAPSDIMLDTSDLVLLPLLLLVLLRFRGRLRTVPGFWLWFTIGCWISVSYLVHPLVQEYLTGPMQIGYQIYRYCWKPILYYPLFMLLIDRRSRLVATLYVVVLAGDLLALEQTYLGYTSGSRGLGNAFGNWIVVPYVVALWGVVLERRLRVRLFYGASLLLMIRALLFAASRGAWVGVFVGTAVLAVLLLRLPAARARAPLLLLAGSLLVAVGLLAKPDLLERPNVQAILTLRSAASDHNLLWRVERWRHFAGVVAEHPWFGTGEHVDPNWEGSGSTPHNSYLSLALFYGVPAALGIVGFALFALARGVAMWRHADPWSASLGVLVVAALTGLLVRSVVEQTLIEPLVIRPYWLMCALPALARLPAAEPSPAPKRLRARRRRTAMRQPAAG